MGVLRKDRRNISILETEEIRMCGKQKTLESFSRSEGTESPSESDQALSIRSTQSEERVTYDNLIELVLDDSNIEEALKKVVGNRGAPGVDGMTVHELAQWLPSNIDSLKRSIREGSYIPVPVRRKEIPKPNGGVRNLGIPTVKDRLVQQMVAQVLEPLYEPTFSEHSYGFRPGRSAQDAILQAKEYVQDGYTVVVDLDLEKFFDNLNQDILMNILRERIKDRALITLVKRFLRAGVTLPDGLTEPTLKGSPQGGPLSPLLSNIYLDRFDKVLEARRLRFCRYADDCVIYVRTQRAGERVLESCTRYLEGTLKLRVNREKTHVGSPEDYQFLGFIIHIRKDKVLIGIHKDKIVRFKKEIRRITKRNRGRSLENAIIPEVNSFLRGWTGYFGISEEQYVFRNLDGWIRTRIRQYLVKQWKWYGTIVDNLKGMCPPNWRRYLAFDGQLWKWTRACKSAASARGWWAKANHPTIKQALNNQRIRDMGLLFMEEEREKVRERCSNRRVPNGTHGGVGGRLTA